MAEFRDKKNKLIDEIHDILIPALANKKPHSAQTKSYP